MSLLNRRRMTLVNQAADDIDIPIGVNLIDFSALLDGWYDQRNNYSNYNCLSFDIRKLRKSSDSRSVTNGVRYDSRAEFSVSGLYGVGNTAAGLLFDETGVFMGTVDYDTASDIKSRVISLEESTGRKGYYLFLTLNYPAGTAKENGVEFIRLS